MALAGAGTVLASIASYRNAEVVITTSGERAAILVLADLFHPAWRVFVDGEERPLLRANYLFRGVYLTPGSHRVRFRFDPFSWHAIRRLLSLRL